LCRCGVMFGVVVLLFAALAVARDVSAELSGVGFQWGWAAVQNATGYASPVASSAVGGYSSLGVSPVAWSASLYLLPSPFSYSWLLGNYTISAELGDGCLAKMGVSRYALFFEDSTRYVATPPILLGQNFTIIIIAAVSTTKTEIGWGWSFLKWYDAWGGEISGTVRSDGIGVMYVRAADLTLKAIPGWTVYSSEFRTVAYVGSYYSADNVYQMSIYINGVLRSRGQFAGQRYTSNSSIYIMLDVPFFRYVYAFYVYNRTLTEFEIAAIHAWPLSPPLVGLVLWYLADPAYFNGTHWLDLSGNGRHGKVEKFWWAQTSPLVRLVQVVEPLYIASQCGYVDVSARWDGFTASFNYNGRTVASAFAPAYLWFNGTTQYGVVPISFYGWQGLTIEQYIYVPPCKLNTFNSKPSMYGNYWYANNTYVALFSNNVYCNYWFAIVFGYRRPDGSERGVVWAYLGLGRWHHVVVTFNKTTMTARLYINGTLVRQGTWDYQYTIFDYSGDRYSRFVLGANIYFDEKMTMAYSYVRIYSRELSPDEIRQNMQSPNSPTTRGLELWLHWDSFDGTRWLDKSGKGRHAVLYGGVRRYPPLGWGFGLFLRNAYPQTSPVVVGRLALNWTSAAVATWGPSGFAASAGTWDVSRVSGALVARVDGAYVDAGGMQGLGSASFYLGQQYSLGVSGVWTPSDSWRGWVSLFSASGLWLNITQVGGHGVAVPGQAVRGYSGTYALTYSGGAASLYANGTAAVSWTAQLPSNAYPLQAYLLAPASSGLRALLYHMWLSPGVALGPNGTSTCGSLRCTPLDHSAPYPQEKAYLIDFRWSPPVSSLGVLPPLPAVARKGGSPGVLTPVTLTGAVKAANAIWGPFGEVCPGRLPNGSLITFGVKYTWQSPSAQPSCSTPLQTAPPAGTISTGLFNATAPVQLYFASPPIQHPYVVNSVPGARFCSLNATHFAAPYLLLPVRAPGSTVVADRWACAPSDYFVGGHVGQSAPGWALIVPVMRVFRVNTTSVVYLGSGSAVLARGGAVPALSVRAVDGRTWSIYTSGAGAVASAGPLQTPPNVSRTGGAVSGVFGAPRSPTTLVSQWWADGVRYYISAAGLADAPVAYISSFTGSPVAVAAELNAPGGYSYYVGVLDNGTYAWAVPLTGPMQFSVYIPAPGYYEVRLYRDADRVWGKNAYLSPDTKLIIGPVDIPVFKPVNPVSLVTPVAPKPPVFVPVVTMQMPPHAVGVLMLGVFAAAYVTMREVSLAALITGAVVAALGVLINAPIYGVAGVFLLAFGLWNKARRQGSV